MFNQCTLPAMSTATLGALLRILAPYRDQPVSRPVLELALQLARKESAQ